MDSLVFYQTPQDKIKEKAPDFSRAFSLVRMVPDY